MGGRVDSIEVFGRILEKCSTSCSLTEVSWKSGTECDRRTVLGTDRRAIRRARWREAMVVSEKDTEEVHYSNPVLVY